MIRGGLYEVTVTEESTGKVAERWRTCQVRSVTASEGRVSSDNPVVNGRGGQPRMFRDLVVAPSLFPSQSKDGCISSGANTKRHSSGEGQDAVPAPVSLLVCEAYRHRAE